MDVLILSRIQFALNISFHYIFPPLSIGLGLMLVLMEGTYLVTKNPLWEQLTKFWVKIFALIFAVGVASGLVMVFSFGTNWANYSRFVASVSGSVLAAEGIFAFFLESGFLGLLLFGWNKISPKMHFFSTLMVALGAHFSAVWIVIFNSWMQTPAGYKIVNDGTSRRAEVDHFLDVIFNPSTLDRLAHVIVACWITGAFLILSVTAYYILKKRYEVLANKAFKLGIVVATVTVLLQLVSGDSTARGVAVNQPVKLAAFEGVFEQQTPTPIYISGYVDAKNKQVKGISVPGGLSFLVYRSFSKPVTSLSEFPQELWPNVPIVFQTYHLMIGMWGLMFLGVVWSWWAIWRKKLSQSRWLLRYLVISIIFPQVANQMGWYSAEMGRQPWIVYGLLKTKDGVSSTIQKGEVLTSLILFSVIYFLLFVLFIYLLDRKIKKGPEAKIEEYRKTYPST